MALEPCPHCGRAFDHDNVGARTNHVNACGETASQSSPSTQNQEQQTVEMVVEDSPNQQTQETRPARQDQVGLSEAGQTVGEGIRAVQDTSRNPTERAQGLAAAGGTIIQLASGIFEQVAASEKAEEQAERERAKTADLEKDHTGPQCVTDGCSHNFGKLPVGENRVRCPQCGQSYTING